MAVPRRHAFDYANLLEERKRLQQLRPADMDLLQRAAQPGPAGSGGGREASELGSAALDAADIGEERFSRREEGVVYEGRSFGWFDINHPARARCIDLLENVWFERFIVLCIVVNCALLAAENPRRATTLEDVNNALFTTIFTIEMCIKMMAFGLYKNGTSSYFKVPWNRLDFAVVVVGLASLSPNVRSLSFFRVLRLLRPLRTLSGSPGMRVLVGALFKAIPMLKDTFVLFGFVFLIFGISGLQFFGGQLHTRCVDEATGSVIDDTRLCRVSDDQCPVGQRCAGDQPNPDDGLTGFDSILQSWLTLLQIISLEGWSQIMYYAMDAVSGWSILFFLALVVLGGFILSNLITAVVWGAYQVGQEEENVALQAKLRHQLIELAAISRLARLHSELSESRGGASTSIRSPSPDPSVASPSVVSAHRVSAPRSAAPPSGDERKEGETQTGESRRALLPPHPRQHAANGLAALSPRALATTVGVAERPHSSSTLSALSPHSAGGGNGGASGAGDVAAGGGGTGQGAAGESGALELQQLGMADAKRVASLIESEDMARAQRAQRDSGQLFAEAVAARSAELSEAPLPAERWARLWLHTQRVCFVMAISPLFDAFFMLCILVNTALLAAEHKGQSDSLVRGMEIGNAVLTLLFVVELSVKLIALRPRVFFLVRFNQFDSVIVGVGILELILLAFSVSSVSVSAFRSLRLLRIVKLGRRSRNFQALVATMGRALDAMAYFAVILGLFIFVFALLGRAVFVEPILDGEGQPARFGFQSLAWALLSVFQVMGGENWNENLRFAVDTRGWGAALYFVVTYLLGRFILLNLFLAILLSNFSGNDEEPEGGSMGGYDGEPEPKVIGSGASETRRLVQLNNKAAKPATLSRPEVMGRALCFLTPEALNHLRVRLHDLVTSRRFEFAVLVVIMLSTVSLAIDDASVRDSSSIERAVFVIDIVSTALFSLEATLRILAHGFAVGPHAYLRDSWNQLDFFVLVMGIIDLAVGGFRYLRPLRTLRALRPLRLVRRYESLKVVVKAFLFAIPKISGLVVVLMFVIFVFGVLGVQFFKGRFFQCELAASGQLAVDSNGAALGKDACVGPGLLWKNPDFGSFDNIGLAMFFLFQLSTMEGWPIMMLRLVDAGSATEGPRRDSLLPAALFGVVFIFITSYFLTNLFIGVVVDTFKRMQNRLLGSAFLTREQRLWLEVQRMVLHVDYDPPLVPPPAAGSRIRLVAFRIVSWGGFDNVMMVFIVLNIFVLLLWFFDAPLALLEVIRVANLVFVLIFVLEAAVKLVALGVSQYFASKWNWLDFVVVVTSFISSVVELSLADREVARSGGGAAADSWFDPTTLRLFRVLRVLRLVKRAKGVRKMLRTLRFALPAILNVGGILLLLLVVYAVMGMQLFGGAQHRVFVTRLANFDNFPLAMLTLFRITTGEAWNGIMTDLMRKPSEQCETGGECGSYAAVPYFFSFVLLVQMVMMNLFVAVVIEEFDGDFAKADEPEVPVTSEDINGYVHAWAEFNPVPPWWKLWEKQDYWMPWQRFLRVLSSLKGDISFPLTENGRIELNHLRELRLPLHQRTVIVERPAANGVWERESTTELCVHFLEGLLAVCFRTFSLKLAVEGGSTGAASSASLIPSHVERLRFIRSRLARRYGELAASLRAPNEEDAQLSVRKSAELRRLELIRRREVTLVDIVAASRVQACWRALAARRQLHRELAARSAAPVAAGAPMQQSLPAMGELRQQSVSASEAEPEDGGEAAASAAAAAPAPASAPAVHHGGGGGGGGNGDGEEGAHARSASLHLPDIE